MRGCVEPRRHEVTGSLRRHRPNPGINVNITSLALCPCRWEPLPCNQADHEGQQNIPLLRFCTSKRKHHTATDAKCSVALSRSRWMAFCTLCITIREICRSSGATEYRLSMPGLG